LSFFMPIDAVLDKCNQRTHLKKILKPGVSVCLCANVMQSIAVVIGSNEPEKAWNAFRFANLAVSKSNTVKVFLMNSGVECLVDVGRHNVKTLSQQFEDKAGKVLACGTCVKSRNLGQICEISNMETFYSLVTDSDRVVYF